MPFLKKVNHMSNLTTTAERVNKTLDWADNAGIGAMAMVTVVLTLIADDDEFDLFATGQINDEFEERINARAQVLGIKTDSN